VTSHPDLAIEASGLVKTFGKTRAVDGIDLAVPSGTVFGVLGPNGAGKSTVIKLLSTLLRPESGTARVLGHDVVREARAVRRRIALTGQTTSVDEDLTGLQNLILPARLLGLAPAAAKARAEELIEAFGLQALSGRLLKTYSGGERRRMDIAASLVVTPDLLFLDEPTTGLDPRSRMGVWAIVRAMVDDGVTVLLTTQYLDEADRLSDTIALVDRGKVIAEGTPSELKALTGTGTLQVRVLHPGDRDKAEQVLRAALGVEVSGGAEPVTLSARVGDAQLAARALAALAEADLAVAEFALGQPSLDEVFMTLTDRPVADGALEAQEVTA
jgi:ABC-2 type transport system ATP-binding protein